jgi:hypothetical protein
MTTGDIQTNPTPAGTAPADRPLKLSIVIPVYNEEATVQYLVGLVVRAPLPPA